MRISTGFNQGMSQPEWPAGYGFFETLAAIVLYDTTAEITKRGIAASQ
jgi:hypothetical protein